MSIIVDVTHVIMGTYIFQCVSCCHPYVRMSVRVYNDTHTHIFLKNVTPLHKYTLDITH